MTVDVSVTNMYNENEAIFVLIPTITVGFTKEVFFGICISFLCFTLDIEFIKDETI